MAFAREIAQVARGQHTPPTFSRAFRVPQPCNLEGISMNIQQRNSAYHFRMQSEREQTF